MNRATLDDYVNMVWPVKNDSFIALRGFHEKNSPSAKPLLKWIEAGDPRRTQKIESFIRECDRRGIAAYCIPGLVGEYGKAGTADVMSMSTICIDIDNPRDDKTIDDLVSAAASELGRPTMVIRSGGVTPDGQYKTYVFWKLSRTIPVSDVCSLRERLAAAYGGDRSFKSAHQPIRLPTSTHRKAEPRPVEIKFFDSASTLEPAHADQHLPTLVPATNGASRGSGSALGFQYKVSLDDLILRRVGHGDPEVTRFEALTRIAGVMLCNIHDVNDSAEIEREFGYFTAWCRTHIENIERDKNLRQHWQRLLHIERAKRSSGRRVLPRRRYVTRRINA